jgi:Putative auto-transporter adhesin, head GIN domain
MTRASLVLLFALTGCGIVGNGKITSSSPELPAFRRVRIESAFTARATTGARAVTVRTDENIMQYVQTLVESDTLVVRLSGIWKSPSLLEVDISNDLFEGIEASGAADVTAPATPVTSLSVRASGASNVKVTGVSSSDFSAEATGLSTIELAGAATQGTATASGGSILRLRLLPVLSLTVAASGGSLVTARVSSTLTGTCSGESTVAIVGNPTNGVDTSGSSRVILNVP